MTARSCEPASIWCGFCERPIASGAPSIAMEVDKSREPQGLLRRVHKGACSDLAYASGFRAAVGVVDCDRCGVTHEASQSRELAAVRVRFGLETDLRPMRVCEACVESLVERGAKSEQFAQLVFSRSRYVRVLGGAK